MSPQYYLLTQTSNDLVVIGMKGQDKCLRRTAAEVLAEPRLLAELSPEDRAIVEAIANMSNTHRKRRRLLRKKPPKDCI